MENKQVFNYFYFFLILTPLADTLADTCLAFIFILSMQKTRPAVSCCSYTVNNQLINHLIYFVIHGCFSFIYVSESINKQ